MMASASQTGMARLPGRQRLFVTLQGGMIPVKYAGLAAGSAAFVELRLTRRQRARIGVGDGSFHRGLL